MDFHSFSLANGLRVILNEDHSAPLVAVNLWYHVGSKDEKRGRTGFAHLFEHMLFAGSENVGNNEHFRYVQSVGGNLNASTTFDRTNYFETLPSNYLALALWLESDRMGFYLPAITQEKFDIQKNVVKEERRQRFDNAPYGTAIEELLKLAYDDDYPYHSFIIGSMDHLDASTVDDVREFFRTWYVPNNAVLTIVGDFQQAEAIELVERYFGDIPRGKEIERSVATRRPMGGERRATITSAVHLPRVYRIYHVPAFTDAGWIRADLLGGVLASGKSSRLEKSLVYEQQIAQDVTGFVWDTEASGMLLIAATAREGIAAETLEAAIDSELERLLRDGISTSELDRVRNQTETLYAHEIEDFDSRADQISRLVTYFGDPLLTERWLDRYEHVGVDEVVDLARSVLRPEERATLHVVPANGKGDRA
jgi:zinc protease